MNFIYNISKKVKTTDEALKLKQVIDELLKDLTDTNKLSSVHINLDKE